MGTIRRSKKNGFSLFGKTRSAILALLFGRGDETLYLRQIVRAVDRGQGVVQRELETLSEAGIIKRHERENQVYYCANKDCPIYPELKNLMIKTHGLARVIAEALEPLAGDIDFAFVYGSQAEGTATVTSDVDCLIVGDVEEIALHRAMMKAEQRCSRTVNYTLMARREFDKRRRGKAGFLLRILSGPKISIMGDVDEIR